MSSQNTSNDLPYYSEYEKLKFYILGDEENKIESSVTINNRELFRGDLPIAGGIYDAHMGTTDNGYRCGTCGSIKKMCPGHYGLLNLRYPVKSPMFRKQILKILKIICIKCGSLLLNKNLPNIDKIPSYKRITEYAKASRNIKKCAKCNYPKPEITADKTQKSLFKIKSQGKAAQLRILYNHEIKEILEKMSYDTLKILGKENEAHPKKMIISFMRVPPNTIRPDIRRSGVSKSSSNDVTALLKTMVEINELLPATIPKKSLISNDLDKMYFNLDTLYYEMIRGASSTNNQVRVLTNTNKAPSSISNRFQTKEGRIRRNLMGKRVRNMMRSVISCDNTLRIDQIGIPKNMARAIQVKETVQYFNKDRLNVYFLNKLDKHPGCTRITKKTDGRTYKIEYLDKEYVLQNGDIIHRDIIDGDYVCFNRQPSLLISNISAMEVLVLDTQSYTIKNNVSSCVFFNADYDGDAVNVLCSTNIQTQNELGKLSNIKNWIISSKSPVCMVGIFQDSLIGTAEFTKKGVSMDKWHAMTMLSQVSIPNNTFQFDKDNYTSREIISMILPPINISGVKPQIYMEQYAHIINYEKEDISVEIHRGKLLQGILDKKIGGQEKSNTMFQIINNDYGPDRCLDTIYSFQQVTMRFFLHNGFTIGLQDLIISEKALREIKRRTKRLMLEADEITRQLDKGILVPPIGMSIQEFYEAEQLNALQPGDDFVEPILSDIDFDTHSLARIIFTGSKGKMGQFISMNAAVGSQTVGGERPREVFGYARTSPFYLRYDKSPEANGYVAQSYFEGVKPESFPFIASEARHSMINNALSTSVSGHQNRLSIKSLESIMIDNHHRSSKGDNIVQLLYADTGMNPSLLEIIKIPTINISDEDLELNYKSKSSTFDVKYQSSELNALLEDEFAIIKKERDEYRKIYLWLEYNSAGTYNVNGKNFSPVNIYRILKNSAYTFKTELENVNESLNPFSALKHVQYLCENISYIYMNSTKEKKQSPVPQHFQIATFLLQMQIHSILCLNNLIKFNIGNDVLDNIINKIKIKCKIALMDPGSCVGVMAAQCISEPLTQYVLDSKHRAGVGGASAKTDTIKRVEEILGAKPKLKMMNPSCYIRVKPQYETDKHKIQEIANTIEMMNFNRFVKSIHIFFEEYGTPVHPEFKHEHTIISDFEKRQPNSEKPNNLTKWCIRFELDRIELMSKHMSLKIIIRRLILLYPDIHFVYTSSNSEHIIIRSYLTTDVFKTKPTITSKMVINLMKDMRKKVIRGIKGIRSAKVLVKKKTFIDSNGGLETKNIFIIKTLGSNLEALLDNPYIDPHHTQTDSILDMKDMFGIESARQKIIIEMQDAMNDISPQQCSVYADEMSWTGTVTNIRSAGLRQREMNNVCLRLSFQSPSQVIESSSFNTLVNKIEGISANLICGQTPKVGTGYNKIIMNEKFMQNRAMCLADQLNDL